MTTIKQGILEWVENRTVKGKKLYETKGQVIRKAGEEFGEFIEALYEHNCSDVILEAGDLAITILVLLQKKMFANRTTGCYNIIT